MRKYIILPKKSGDWVAPSVMVTYGSVMPKEVQGAANYPEIRG